MPALEYLLERLPILRCPDCNGRLRGNDRAFVCEMCGRSYPQDGEPFSLIGSTSELNLSEISTQDEVSSSYADARYQHDYSLRYHRSVLERMTEEPTPRGTVLDSGCGPGLLLEHLDGFRPEVKNIVGIDVSQGMLRHAGRAIATADNSFVFRADACRLPFADASFDVVYARGLLHHLPDPNQGIEEIHRVLKPGGSVVVLEPNKNFVSALPRLLARLGRHFDRDHKNFRANYLTRIVSKSLEVERVGFFGYVAYFVLGFPDIVDFGRFLPMRRLPAVLMKLDDLLARVPGLRRLGWAIVIVASRPEQEG